MLAPPPPPPLAAITPIASQQKNAEPSSLLAFLFRLPQTMSSPNSPRVALPDPPEELKDVAFDCVLMDDPVVAAG